MCVSSITTFPHRVHTQACPLASLSGIASYVDIRAKTDTYVGFLSHSALERLLEKRPIVLLTLAKRLISLLSPLGETPTQFLFIAFLHSLAIFLFMLVLQIDSALDWMQVNAGQVLWRPGEPSDSFYIVINGRLRDIAEKENGTHKKVNIIDEYGQGLSILVRLLFWIGSLIMSTIKAIPLGSLM